MSELYSCAIVGQRPTRFKFKYNEYMTSCKRIKKRLHDVFVMLFQRGVRQFYVGGALGVDMWSGEILLEMRQQEEYQELKLVLVYPFPGHADRWDSKSQARLRYLKENCDEFVMGSIEPGGKGYNLRTAYMAEHADCIVAVYNNEPQERSGVEVAIRIAKAKALPVVLIHPDTGKINCAAENL